MIKIDKEIKSPINVGLFVTCLADLMRPQVAFAAVTLLESVVGQANSLHAMITALDLRVKTMNNEVVRIDTLISTVVGVKPDLDRIARADGQKDARKD